MDKKMNKLKSPSIIALFLIIIILSSQSISAQNAQNKVVSKFERVTDLDALALKISFHSWGEGRTEELNLDQYFPVKRDPNSRYVYLAPPEISVSIDQNTGIARLTAFKDWTGTKEIIFSLTDIYKLEATLSSLQKYRELITQQRAPARLKQEFEDLPSYHLFEKILDDLESEASRAQSRRVEVTKVDNSIKVSLGKEINMVLDLQTLTEENLPTLKPKIAVTIQPEEEPSQVQGEGLSFFIFIPLILIVITLLIIGVFYVKKNKEKIKKHFKKEKQKPTAYNKLIEQKRELSSISNKLDQQPIKQSVDAVFNVIKNFFNVVTLSEYQFSYSEIKKEQFEKALSEALKEKLCQFSREISDIRFSDGVIQKPELKKIIKQTQQLISSASNEEKLILEKKEHERLKKTLPVRIIKYVLDSFEPDKKISAEKIKEKIDIKKKSQSLLHRLGIIRTLAEKEFERKKKYFQKLRQIKEKEHERELKKRKEEAEKEKKELLKIREKQQKEHLKWLKEQRKIREAERKQEERRQRRLARAKAIRDFFHNKFGLFKTVKDLEKELEEKRKKSLEKERIKRTKRRMLKRSVLGFLHFLRLYKTLSEKHEKELILKKEERLKKQHKERIREARKQAFLSFLHKLKLYRTREEIEREKEKRLRKLREKQRKKEEEYRRKELERLHERRRKQNEKLRKLEEKKRKQPLKEKKRELARAERKEYIKRKKKEIKKYLHDHLGLFKTLEEKERDREARYREKLRKQRIEEQKRLEKLKIKQHLEREIQKKQQKEIKSAERKRRLKAFFHDHLGLFKTREEIEKSRLERREHRIELEHKLEDTVLKSLASRFGRKKLAPEQEIKILMQLEEEALKKGNTEKSEEIKKIINKLYSKIRKPKTQHPSLLLNKLKNDLESARDYIFSSTSKLDSLSPFIKKLNSTIRSSLEPKIENAKLDQINYLINKSEIELRRNKREEAKEFYSRAVYLYRSMNKASQKIALPILLKVKNEITSTAIISSLEKAFSAIYTGQIKKAEKLYKNIDINFLNLPTSEREKVYDKKEELYQKIKEQKETQPQQAKKYKLPISEAIKNLFRKEKKSKFYPLTEERFKPKQPTFQVKEEKAKQDIPRKKESIVDFILARRPKFPSIKTEIQDKKYRRALAQKLFSHIRATEKHLESKNHEKAHHNYKQAISIFKDLHLNPEIRDNVYKNLNELKEKIIHTSIHNFMKKTKESVKKEDLEQAKKFHKSLEGIYNHLQRKREKEISDENIPDSLLIERKLNEAFSALRKNNLDEAFSLYNKINSHYNDLKPEEKKAVYPRLITLYSELMKKQEK